MDDESKRVLLKHSAERPEAEAIRREFDNRIAQIASTLDQIRSRSNEWNERLPSLVKTRVMERREKAERDQTLSLGYASAQPAIPAAPKPQKGVFTDGQQFDALRELQRIIASAKRSIVVIDPYVDESILDLLSGKRGGVNVHLLAKPMKATFAAAAKAFNTQHRGLSVRRSEVFHDRFVIIDGTAVYHFGASLKDAGKRVFRLSEMKDEHERKALTQRFASAWAEATDESLDRVPAPAPPADPEVKWVNLQYSARTGIEDDLRGQGFKLYWSAEDQLAERIDVEGWEVAVIERDGKRFILKGADPVLRVSRRARRFGEPQVLTCSRIVQQFSVFA